MAKRKISKKAFNNALSIRQVGAKRILNQQGKPLFKLGGGIFTERQIIGSRKRFAKVMGFKFK